MDYETRYEDLKPSNDIIFKRVFGKKSNEDILIRFLNDVLKQDTPIVSVDLMNPELTPEHVSEKGSRLDLLAKTSDGELIDIECQVEQKPGFVSRFIYYGSKIFSRQLKTGDSYTQIKRTVSICVANFAIDEFFGRYHAVYRLMEVNVLKELSKLMEYHVLCLPNLLEITNDEDTQWGAYLKDPYSSEAENLYNKIPLLNKAKNEFEYTKADPETRYLIDLRLQAQQEVASEVAAGVERGREQGIKEGREQGIEQGRKEGIKEGREQGIEQGRKEGIEQGEKKAKFDNAKKFLSMGLTVEQVAEGVGLSIEEIEAIKKKIL